MSRRLLLALVLATAMASGCASSPGDTGGLSTDPPWGLDTVDMPDDSEAINALMNAMPDEIDGASIEGRYLDGDQSFDLMYADGTGRSLALGAISIAGFAGEGMSSYDFLSILVEGGEIGDVESNLDSTETVFWMAGTSGVTADGATTTEYVAGWSGLDGEWIFSVSADTPDARTALIHAFVESLKGAS